MFIVLITKNMIEYEYLNVKLQKSRSGGGHTTLAELAVVRRGGVPMAAARASPKPPYQRGKSDGFGATP